VFSIGLIINVVGNESSMLILMLGTKVSGNESSRLLRFQLPRCHCILLIISIIKIQSYFMSLPCCELANAVSSIVLTLVSQRRRNNEIKQHCHRICLYCFIFIMVSRNTALTASTLNMSRSCIEEGSSKVRGEYSARERARRHVIGWLYIDSSQFTHDFDHTGMSEWITEIRSCSRQHATCEHGDMKCTASTLYATCRGAVNSAAYLITMTVDDDTGN